MRFLTKENMNVNSKAPMISPKKIKTIGDRCLRQKSEEVEFDKNEMELLYAEMCQAMWMSDGIGLAAPQIGISKQLAVIRINEDNERYPEAEKSEEIVIFNPQITVLDDTLQGFWEGCLSVPGLRGVVFRPRKVQINFLDQSAKEVSFIAEDFLATVFQHELDHLFGKLFVDRIEDISTLSFEDELVLSEEDKEI